MYGMKHIFLILWVLTLAYDREKTKSPEYTFYYIIIHIL